jgi:hypothetical protein
MPGKHESAPGVKALARGGADPAGSGGTEEDDMSGQTLRRRIATPDNIKIGDMLVTEIGGEHIVGIVKDGGLTGGCDTDLYLAYVCSVGDAYYDEETMDELDFLCAEDVPEWLSI